MKPEKLSILNNKKEKLVGHLYKGSSKTIIIICHGLESVNNFSDVSVQKILRQYFSDISHKTGASVFSFDFSGYGESEGESFLSFKQRDAEIKVVLDYFSPLYEKVILYGFSMGGLSAAIAAAENKEVAGLISINGYFSLHPKKLYRKHIAMISAYLISKPHFLQELFWFKKLRVSNITIPTLVVYADKDSVVNPKQSISFFDTLLARKKQVIFETSDHALLKENLRLPQEIGKWLKEERLV